jgi:hypothetical protein
MFRINAHLLRHNNAKVFNWLKIGLLRQERLLSCEGSNKVFLEIGLHAELGRILSEIGGCCWSEERVSGGYMLL